MAVRPHLLHGGAVLAAGKRRLSGEQVIKRAAETVDVRADVDITATFPLLRRGEIDGAKELPVGRQLAARLASFQGCQAQVENLDDAGRGDEQVGRLDVPVNEFLIMHMLQAQCGLTHQLARFSDRQQPALRD